jgi:hypothetical protein
MIKESLIALRPLRGRPAPFEDPASRDLPPKTATRVERRGEGSDWGGEKDRTEGVVRVKGKRRMARNRV